MKLKQLNIFHTDMFTKEEVESKCNYLIKHGKIIDISDSLDIKLGYSSFNSVGFVKFIEIRYRDTRHRLTSITTVYRNMSDQPFREYSNKSCCIYDTLEDASKALSIMHGEYTSRLSSLKKQYEATLKKGIPLLESVEKYSTIYPEYFI